jgi:hypothetical protein
MRPLPNESARRDRAGADHVLSSERSNSHYSEPTDPATPAERPRRPILRARFAGGIHG